MSEAELRRRFAEAGYLNRAARGEFGCCLTAANSARSAGEPAGTRTVVVSFVDDAFNRIFMVHFYLRPDGTMGASGIPDPRWLFEPGVVNVAEK